MPEAEHTGFPEHHLVSPEKGESSGEQKNTYDPEPTIKALKQRLTEDYVGLQESIAQQLTAGTITQEKADDLLNRLDQLSKKDLGYEVSKSTSIERAEKLLGQGMFFGPEAVKKAFDIELDEVPVIPFSETELKNAKEFDQFLVLRTNIAPDGQPLTMAKIEKLLQPVFEREHKPRVLTRNAMDWLQEEPFFQAETPKLQWALTTRRTIPGSERKSHLEQTRLLANYLTEVFEGTSMSREYVEAIEEFNSQEEEIKHLISIMDEENFRATTQKMANLKLNQLTRQTPVEVLYDQLIYFQNNEQYILRTETTYTNTLSLSGFFVHIGDTDSQGAKVDTAEPDVSANFLGVLFSRTI